MNGGLERGEDRSIIVDTGTQYGTGKGAVPAVGSVRVRLYGIACCGLKGRMRLCGVPHLQASPTD